MSNEQWAYIFGFSSVICYSTASLAYAYFTHRVSPFWLNIFKNSVAFTLTLIALALGFGSLSVDWTHQWPFFISGIIGLNLADYLLLSAYRWMGAGRTLILFGFQPLLTGLVSYFVWGEQVYGLQFLAIFFLVLCLFFFSYERFQQTGRWEVQGLIFGVSGVLLDTIGVLLTKYGFQLNPGMSGLESHYVREIGALMSFGLMLPFAKAHLWAGFLSLSVKQRWSATLASAMGTFLSLVFYMEALKWGKIATVNSIILADPMIATSLECLWLRVWPSRSLIFAVLAFFGGMFCLFYPQL